MADTENKGGKPTKLDAKRAETILTLIKGGNTQKSAAAAAGITTKTLENWKRWGKEEDALRGEGDESEGSEYLRFFRALMRANAEAEILMQNAMREAAIGYKATKTITRTHTKTEVVRKADGSPLTDKKTGKPLTVEISDTVVTQEESSERDWRAAESWLKRRNPADFGDRIDINKLDDETILRMLERDAEYQESLKAKADDVNSSSSVDS